MTARKIAVVIPGYNHTAYIGTAIESVLSQDWPEIELHVLDDGSSDDTAAVAERSVAGQSQIRCHIERQENQGSARTLNRLIDRVDADYVSILNSDDVYQPGRLRAFATRAEPDDLFFGVSGVKFIRSGQPEDFELFETAYSSRIGFCESLPTCGYALLSANITFTSSNFFFSRELYDLVGGFDPTLPLTQDWDFSLHATRWTEPVLLPERLLSYRVHPHNTWRRLKEIRRTQSERVLEKFGMWASDPCLNPLAPTPRAWPRFFPYFVRVCGSVFDSGPIGASLPAALHSLPADGEAASGRDNGAVARLVARARSAASGDANAETALSATAAHWESVRGTTDRRAEAAGAQPALAARS